MRVTRRESVSPIYFASSGHRIIDGGHSACGIVAFRQLPVSALPQVDYPTIQVITQYPGASPDVMASTVTAPLERQFGEMQGLSQMTSTSAGGISVIVLQFQLHADHRRSGTGSAVGYQCLAKFLAVGSCHSSHL